MKSALYTCERALHILNLMRTPTGSMHLIRKRVIFKSSFIIKRALNSCNKAVYVLSLMLVVNGGMSLLMEKVR